MNRYQEAMKNQGFQQPFDESPITLPDGWHRGSVQQTGGMVMVRIWYTVPDIREYSGNDIEYEVAYGSASGTSLQRLKWDGDFYMFDEVIESVSVEENTDDAKAEAAKELMEQHQK